MYATEAIASQSMPEGPGDMFALAPLNGSISCLRRVTTIFAGKFGSIALAKSPGTLALEPDNIDSDNDTTNSDLTPDDESELNNYEAWRGQPASTPRRATKEKVNILDAVVCEGKGEAECEEEQDDDVKGQF